MAINKFELKPLERITYGFPNADCPDFDSAVDVAKVKLREEQEKYADRLIEGWLERGETSVWGVLKLRKS